MPKIPKKKKQDNLPDPGENSSSVGSRDSRVVGLIKSTQGPVGETMRFLSEYIVMPPLCILVISSWVAAAWLSDNWDRFPHLAITSPEKRCGKTLLLQAIETVAPNPYNTTNISPAALYRLVEKERPTLILDEAQSMRRGASEASQVTKEIFHASIDRNAKIIRCGGKRMNELHEFSIYSPKVIALIGSLDGVLADRCLPIEMKRKSKNDIVLPYRSRIVEPRGKKINRKFKTWAAKNKKRIVEIYDDLEPFPIENDRLAELLLPLQAVLLFVNENLVSFLEDYAQQLDNEDSEKMSAGTLLLNACREIFEEKKNGFVGTSNLILELKERTEEPWGRWNRGETISPESLARILRSYGIQSQRTQKKEKAKVKTIRGYYRKDFEDAFLRYLSCAPK